MLYKVKERQSVLDIALQLYGHLDGVQLLIEDNPHLLHSPCAHLLVGDEVFVRDPLDEAAVQALAGQFVATLDAQIEVEERCEGIGYWRIGRNFKVRQVQKKG